MASVLATLKRIYTEDGSAIKHICWFVLSFIGAMISMPGTNGTTPDLDNMYSSNILSIIFGLILTIYTFGYNSIIMHNRFEEEGKPKGLTILPEFDTLPFKIFGRAFVLALVWFIYSLVLGLLWIIPILGCIIYLVITPFMAFVQVSYSKEFLTDGLFNFAIIAKYMRLFWLEAVKWWFKLFICTLVIILLFILIFGRFLGLEGLMHNSMTLILIFALAQYIFMVFGFVNAYGMADIYARKWDDSSY